MHTTEDSAFLWPYTAQTDTQGIPHKRIASIDKCSLVLYAYGTFGRGKDSVVDTTLFFAHNFSPSAYFLDIWVSMES